MAIVIEANYSKKLGLPNYSSHQFSVTVRTELTDINQLEEETSRLYRLLQDAVDHEIQVPGFLPDDLYAVFAHQPGNGSNGNGASVGSTQTNGSHQRSSGRNGHSTNGNGSNGNRVDRSTWVCSDKQREYIQKIVEENNLVKDHVEELSIQMFGQGVKALNRMEASGLIDELLERHGGRHNKSGQRHAHARNGRNGESR